MQGENYTKFKNQIWKDKSIKGYEKLVLIYLISYNNETLGYSFPTKKQIQIDTGVSENTLNKVLNNLIEKGYITKKEHKTKKGRNNIYYIHKYLVESKEIKPVDVDARTKKETNSKAQDLEETPQNAKVNENIVENGREQSTNELIVNENCKLTKKLTKDDIADINKMDTDKLIQAIRQANKSQGNKSYHVNYLKITYRNIKNKPVEKFTDNNSNDEIKADTEANTKDYHNNNYSVKTKYHNTFNEHFRKYTEDELERKLLKLQAKRKELA